jgi:hypothetical protein
MEQSPYAYPLSCQNTISDLLQIRIRISYEGDCKSRARAGSAIAAQKSGNQMKIDALQASYRLSKWHSGRAVGIADVPGAVATAGYREYAGRDSPKEGRTHGRCSRHSTLGLDPRTSQQPNRSAPPRRVDGRGPNPLPFRPTPVQHVGGGGLSWLPALPWSAWPVARRSLRRRVRRLRRWNGTQARRPRGRGHRALRRRARRPFQWPRRGR